ncbi:MAG TPA: cytochrome c-type biogenesis protein [Sphingomonadales bacterium]|nr:cytochrome c-type biogenesis protein [Sphingomonadales bacterium]
MKRTIIVALFLLAAGAAWPALAVAVDEEVLSDPAREAMAKDIMKDVRCLVCQNQAIEDSQAPLARDLRRIVRERVKMGDSRAEIEAFLTARYGDWILLEPPLKIRTLALWTFPFAALVLGGWLALRALRARSKDAPLKPLSAGEKKKLKRLLGREGGR